MDKKSSFSQEKKVWRTTVTNILKAEGFVVDNVKVGVNYKTSPEIGFLVILKGKETTELRKKAEDTLKNYAYNIRFVNP